MPDNVPLNDFPVNSLVMPEPHSPPAGDWNDDDGPALDSYFEAADLGPLISAAIKAAQPEIKKTSNRLTRYRMVLPSVANTPSVMIVPNDVNRSILVIQTSAVASSAGILFSSEAFSLIDDPAIVGSLSAGFLLPANNNLVIPNYTGPLWVTSSDIAAKACVVDVLAVTS